MTHIDHTRRVTALLRQLRVRTLALIAVTSLFWAAALATSCDVTIDVEESGLEGVFQSPGYPHHYSNNLQCFYTFIGAPNQRVQISFDEFTVNGVPPKCTHDYVDIYTQARRPDDSLFSVPLHGRYCGSHVDTLPHLLVSMYDVMIVAFRTDGLNTDTGFKGKFKFIDAGIYMVGTPATPASLCGQIVDVSVVPRGFLLSPTYPGEYPDNIKCFYKLHGSPGQRIRLTFIDLDLYEGGDHCPFDYVRLFDGPTNQAPELGMYCGSLSDVSVFSTREFLHIEFVTRSGRLPPTKPPFQQIDQWNRPARPSEQRGFNASFDISDGFVNLNFITGEHIPGTECDQRLLSVGGNSGWVVSPGFPRPYPLGVLCHYFIDGLESRQDLEKVKLEFSAFDLPFLNKQCDNGVLAAYLNGQDLAEIYGRPPIRSYRREICGGVPPSGVGGGLYDSLPVGMETNAPRLLLILNTTGSMLPGNGFNATFQFVTDYAIEGTPVAEGACHFRYDSTGGREGNFNSPRHPSNYPLDTECRYDFVGRPGDHLRVTFDEFDVRNARNNCLGGGDYLELYEVGPDNQETLISRRCGNKIPGPVMAKAQRVRAMFHSDANDFSTGFDARYEFLAPIEFNKRCDEENITVGGTSVGRKGSGGLGKHARGGVILSPNHPHKYLLNTCHEWHIRTLSAGAQILVVFENFVMEGSALENDPGCPNAVLKVYTNASGTPQYELCGRAPDVKQVLSQVDYIRIQFISAQRAQGAKGFKLTWTEIVPSLGGSGGGPCSGFRCDLSGYCISAALRCDGNDNCGYGDNSDENETCSVRRGGQSALHVILVAVLVAVVFVLILMCVLHFLRRRRKRGQRKEIEVRYVARNVGTGSRGAGVGLQDTSSAASGMGNNHYPGINHEHGSNNHYVPTSSSSGYASLRRQYNTHPQYVRAPTLESPERTMLYERTEKVSIV